jgi:peptidyl-prolyl cis-trans isomerase A (cyclophilin A)
MIIATVLLAAAPIVTLDTSMGAIKIELDQAKAPATVANFLSYVKGGHYDGTVFHRVIPNFMIQGGGMDAAMKEKTTRAPIKNEAANKLRNERGTIAMARTADPDSATAQFFINVRNNAALDYGVGGPGYAVFGRVIEGMDVVDKIVGVQTASRGPHQNVPVSPVVIRSARVTAASAGQKPADEKPAEIDRPEPAQPASQPRQRR